MKFEWEKIYGNEQNHTLRAKVIGGWLVKHTAWTSEADDGNEPVSTTMVFVPDPQHKWGKYPFEGAI